jgi:hypothetical protein
MLRNNDNRCNKKYKNKNRIIPKSRNSDNHPCGIAEGGSRPAEDDSEWSIVWIFGFEMYIEIFRNFGTADSI